MVPTVNQRTTLKRKHRLGEINCECGAYEFPHRALGGSCDGAQFVVTYFEQQIYGECRDCIHRNESEESDDEDGRRGRISCQILEGLEPYLRCPGLEDWVRYHGVKLYGDKAKLIKQRKKK